MPYRASWRLVGKEDQILDRGKLDRIHEHRAEALAEILAQLNQMPSTATMRSATNGGPDGRTTLIWKFDLE